MNFSKEKNGYSVAEVDAYIRSVESAEGDRTLRIEELKSEVSRLTALLDAERQKRDLINKAIYNAVAKADQIETLSRRKYEQDMAQLKAFHEKWTSYYNRILEKYPLDDELREASAFIRRMNDVLNGKDVEPLEAYMEREKERVGKTASAESKKSSRPKKNAKAESFDPVTKIKEFLDVQKSNESIMDSINSQKTQSVNEEYEGEGAFSFEEALNPTEDLSTIMRDLGFDVKD